MAFVLRRFALQSRPWIHTARPPRLRIQSALSETFRSPYHTTSARLKKDNGKSKAPVPVETSKIDLDSLDEIESKLRKAFDDGNTQEVLRLSGRESMTPDELDDLKKTLSQLKDAKAREAVYSKLTDSLLQAPEDAAVVEQIFQQSGLKKEDIEALPLDGSGQPVSEEDVLDTEKAVWDMIGYDNVDMIIDEFETFLTKAGGNNKLAMREFVKHLKTKASDPRQLQEAETKYDLAFLEAPLDKIPRGFWNDDGEEDNDDDDDEDGEEDFDQDDLPLKGHRWLDVQRDIREWSRYAVWELPLLSSTLF
jgi:hypothetical protein